MPDCQSKRPGSALSDRLHASAGFRCCSGRSYCHYGTYPSVDAMNMAIFSYIDHPMLSRSRQIICDSDGCCDNDSTDNTCVAVFSYSCLRNNAHP